MLCLTHPTDPAWIDRAMADLDGVLVDHAHCEMKAASNALSLAARSAAYPGVVRPLIELAEEELGHFRRVLDELERRGLALGNPPVDDYAVELRRRASGSAHPQRGKPGGWLVERLLVGALIEARSCERFQLLARALTSRDDSLAAFYEELFAAEAGHCRLLVDLAAMVSGDEPSTRRRLQELASVEGELVATRPCAATIHG